MDVLSGNLRRAARASVAPRSARALWQLSLRYPALPGLMVAAFVVGALGGIVPGGFLAQPGGAGFGAGAAWGLWAYLAASPVLVVTGACLVAATRYDWRMDRDMFLAGQTPRRTVMRDAVAAAALTLAMLGAAAVGGAVVGSADSVSRGASPLTGFSVVALIAAAGASLWWAVQSVLVATLLRSGAWSALAMLAWFVLSLALMQAVPTQALWNVLTASPSAPFVLATRSVLGAPRGLETHAGLAIAAAVWWSLAMAWLVGRRLRRPTCPRT